MKSSNLPIQDAPAWHAEARELLDTHFAAIHAAFLDSTNRAVWLGLFLNQVKLRGKYDGSIPHGEFGPWLRRTCPGIAWSTACTYMTLARNVAERAELKISDFVKFADGANLSFLQVLEGQSLPTRLADFRERVKKLIAGKTQQQLLLSFRQADATDDATWRARVGRRPGGSHPAETPEQARARARAAALKHSGELGAALKVANHDFFLCDDLEVTAQIEALELALALRRQWLAQPPGRREPLAIEQQLKQHP
jgi:hypothetical protein